MSSSLEERLNWQGYIENADLYYEVPGWVLFILAGCTENSCEFPIVFCDCDRCVRMCVCVSFVFYFRETF